MKLVHSGQKYDTYIRDDETVIQWDRNLGPIPPNMGYEGEEVLCKAPGKDPKTGEARLCLYQPGHAGDHSWDV